MHHSYFSIYIYIKYIKNLKPPAPPELLNPKVQEGGLVVNKA